MDNKTVDVTHFLNSISNSSEENALMIEKLLNDLAGVEDEPYLGPSSSATR